MIKVEPVAFKFATPSPSIPATMFQEATPVMLVNPPLVIKIPDSGIDSDAVP